MSPVKNDRTDFVKFKTPNILNLADSVLHAYGKGLFNYQFMMGQKKLT